MNLREKALELVNDEIARIESGSTMPDTQDVMGYALVLVLADISQEMEEARLCADGILGELNSIKTAILLQSSLE